MPRIYLAMALLASLPLTACAEYIPYGNNGLECNVTETVLTYDPWPQRGSHSEAKPHTFVVKLFSNHFETYSFYMPITNGNILTITDKAYILGKWSYQGDWPTREFKSEITINRMTGELKAENSYRTGSVGMDGYDSETTGICHPIHIEAKKI